MFGLKKPYFAKATKGERIYLDYASATPVLPEVLRAMEKAEATFGNPGSLHAEGGAAKALLEGARENIAHELGCKSRQLVFTSGLTESNNLAILGRARQLEISGRSLSDTHWITSSIEHSSILEAMGEVERRGGSVTFIDPDAHGLISGDALSRALRPSTVFVSIGWGNNEIGVVQKMSELSRIIKKFDEKVIFHSDAGQSPLYLSAHVHTLGVDMLSVGSGKLYGPRSIGALYVRDISRIAPLLLGGGQESGLRSGTEKVVPAVGFAKALQVVAAERHSESKRQQKLRDDLARDLSMYIPGMYINGDLKHALPHMLNISIPGEKSGEYLALQLDREGIAVSTKSACDEGHKASHVVEALSGEAWRAQNTLRFSLGMGTTQRDLERVVQVLQKLAPNRA